MNINIVSINLRVKDHQRQTLAVYFFFFFINLFFLIYLFIIIIIFFLAVLGLRFCARAFSSCGKRGPLFITVRGPLTIAASLVAEHRLQTRGLSSCGSRAQSLHGMWDPPGPGLEPVSPALAGRFSTTAPPGKPWLFILTNILIHQEYIIPEFAPKNMTPKYIKQNLTNVPKKGKSLIVIIDTSSRMGWGGRKDPADWTTWLTK